MNETLDRWTAGSPEARARHRALPLVAICLAGALAFLTASCGDDAGGGAGGSGTGTSGTGTQTTGSGRECDDQGCFDQACFTPPGAAVSFRDDVLPILERSCSLSTACHGNPQSPTTGFGYQPYLGEPSTSNLPSDVEAILAAIVGVDSDKAEGMQVVAPGNHLQSFLMHKMDGTHATCGSVDCFEGCGDEMPPIVGLLPLAERNLVRAWIGGGALDN